MKRNLFLTQALVNPCKRYLHGFLIIILTGLSFNTIHAQSNNDTLRSTMTKITVPENSPILKSNAKTAIPFKAFDMVDKNGRRVNPGEIVTLKNGKQITAREFFTRLNNYERQLNQRGFTLRNSEKKNVKEVITPVQTLDGKVATAPKPIASKTTEDQLTVFNKPSLQVGTVTLKPSTQYTKEEKAKVDKLVFSKVDGKILVDPMPATVAIPAGTATSLKVINKTDSKDWSFGDSRTFKASIHGEMNRYANIFTFDPQHPGSNKSEYKVKANGLVTGSLFNHSLELFNGSAEFYSPADSAKKMTAKVKLVIAGFTVLNLDESYTQTKALSGVRSRSLDKSFSLSIPIGLGFSFSGKIGVRGNASLQYDGGVYRTFAAANIKPAASISGYAEAGIDFLSLVDGGVGGRLTFVKGSLDMRNYIGVWTQTASQIVVGYGYYYGYDIEMLSGDLYCYVDLCAPILGCYRVVEFPFFHWNGYDSQGTIAQGNDIITIANL